MSRREIPTAGRPCDRPWAAAAIIACLAGCATASKPGMGGLLGRAEQTQREREHYGPTADQRIKDIAAEAAGLKAAAAERQAEFTGWLAAAMLAEHDPRVRCAIVEAASGFDTPASTAICTGALEDPEPRVRMQACSACASLGGPEAVHLLANRYRTDAELDVRLRALRELGHLGHRDAIPVLAKALEDSDPAVQFRAVAALKRVSGRDLGNDVNRWREWAADPEGSAAEWTIAEGFRRLF